MQHRSKNCFLNKQAMLISHIFVAVVLVCRTVFVFKEVRYSSILEECNQHRQQNLRHQSRSALTTNKVKILTTSIRKYVQDGNMRRKKKDKEPLQRWS